MKKQKIALLYGGISSEREISFATGTNVGQTLESLGHDVVYIDTKDRNQLTRLATDTFDVAYVCLHGKGGEDGKIQGFLETLDIPYTGSGVVSSATAINKAMTKNIYRVQNIPTSPFVNIKKGFTYDVDDIINKIGDHVVVKAAQEGSSFGLFIVEGKENIQEAINKALQIDKDVVVEKFISGKEYTVAVLQKPNKTLESLPVIQIIPKNEYYDFASKYDEGGSKHICPAEIPEKLTKELQDIAYRAYKALGCRGVARTDFIVDEQGKPWALETNTLPGMTKTSLVPDAARAVGISFEELCEILLEDACNE